MEVSHRLEEAMAVLHLEAMAVLHREAMTVLHREAMVVPHPSLRLQEVMAVPHPVHCHNSLVAAVPTETHKLFKLVTE